MNLLTRILCLVCLLTVLSLEAQLALNDVKLANTDESTLITDITAPRTDLLRTEVREYIYGPATRIKFKIIEEESGVASTFFKIADLPFMKSDGRQMVPHDLADGSYTIQYYSIDNVGNQEQIRTGKIYIDKKGPKIRAGFNSTPISFENGTPIFSKNVSLAVEVSDEQVEVHKLTYQINDGEVIESTNTEFLDLTEELNVLGYEKFKVEIRAYDSFYNLSKEVVEFTVRR